MCFVEQLKEKTLRREPVSREEALRLYDCPLDQLSHAADEIREYFCGNRFDLCTIINAKSGRCSEDCKYCAQSAFHQTKAEEYPLMDTHALVAQAKYNDSRGVLRFSIVTSGKRLTDDEVSQVCESVREIRRQTDIRVCASLGLLDVSQFRRLKEAGVTRVHNNLETSRNHFPAVCTTHTYDDKIASIRAAQEAGLNVCSGGIMGIGEDKADRVDMALTLRGLGIRSVPVNMLNPIPGTPYASYPRLRAKDLCRIAAVYRFLLPDASIRLAGGRGLLDDKGKACFQSGANAAISGDMLTTAGITIEADRKLLEELGFERGLCNE